jgi:sugar O-acyltransferase (sialic acid O-acetyltransferase NeuD family)
MKNSADRCIVLYGSGSPILVDFEETCGRRGLDVVAIVNNLDGASYALDAEKVVTRRDFVEGCLAHPVLFPMFTPGHRKLALEEARRLGADRFATLVDPTAVTPSSLELAEGVFVSCGAIVGGMASLGPFSFVNRGASVGHHSRLEEFASLGPAAVLCGHVQVGRGGVVGAGAVVLPGVRVGANAVVAAGAVVTADVPDHCLVAGNPAVIKERGIAGFNGVGV